MAAAGSDPKELLALIHQHLIQTGYARAARELLAQSGQKTLPSSPVPLRDVFAQWKKTSLQTQIQKADEIKTSSPGKIRVPDPESSSESSEEDVAKPIIKSNLPVNNSSIAKAESSSEEEDSSSEEEAIASKAVKIPAAENKTSGFLQLAAQKINSLPGKGVAVAAVQTKGRQNKVTSNKLQTPAVAKGRQNKALAGKPGPVLPSPVVARQNTAVAKPANSESSSSSESEEEKTPTLVKTPAPKPALKKAESSTEDSSDNSDSEEETNTAALKVKPAVESEQVNITVAKSLSSAAVASKGNAVKASPAKKPTNQTKPETQNVARSTKAADSSETSESSDTEVEEPALMAQTKLSGKKPQVSASPVKNAASSLLTDKAASTSTPLKQMPKTSMTSTLRQPPPAKGSVKKAGSSGSSESSSESENEAIPVPVSQKRLPIPQPPTGTKQNQVDKPGTPMKVALKGKESESESSSSSSSDSEDAVIPPAHSLPPPSATKANATAQSVCATKSQPPPGPLREAQESEDSSQDSSDESDSEEETVFTQKPAQVTQKPATIPMKVTAVKVAGAISGKAGNPPSAGKGTASTAKPAAACFQKASETDSSDSSEEEEAAAKTVKQPPIHPFFQQKTNKVAVTPGKGVQSTSSIPDSTSKKCQGPAMVTTGKAKPSQDHALPATPDVILKGKESSGSSSSSDSEEEALTTAKQVPQPAGILQKQGIVKKPDTSSEESSDEDQEASQSLLAKLPGPLKTPPSILLKSVAPVLSPQSSGKAAAPIHSPVISASAKALGKGALADGSSSDSSDSDTDAEETVGQKTEITSLPPSAGEAVVAKLGKGAMAGKRGLGSVASKGSSAKKARAKPDQRNSKAKAGAAQAPLTLLSNVHLAAAVSSKEAVARVPGTAAQEATEATPVVAVKAPKPIKPAKAGAKEKPSKKRKLAAGAAGLEEPKGKKLKGQSVLEVPAKMKKKKKDKSSSSTKPPKKKDGKEKKSDKKKKKNKKLAPLTDDGTEKKKKKKKKKKKTGDLEGAA